VTRDEALALLQAKNQADAARQLGISPQAIAQWPAEGELPERIADRVLAALARKWMPVIRAISTRPE